MILIIDNYDSFTYNLYQAFLSLTKTVKVLRNDAISLQAIRDMAPLGIILSPGPGHPKDAGICVALIQELSQDIPILGICLGHQAIGFSFGAEVNRAKKVLHGKKSLIFHRRSVLFRGVSLPFEGGRYHSLAITKETLPKTLRIDAEDVEGSIMAISHETRPLFGLQFHPESILTVEGGKIMKNFVEFCETKRGYAH